MKTSVKRLMILSIIMFISLFSLKYSQLKNHNLVFSAENTTTNVLPELNYNFYPQTWTTPGTVVTLVATISNPDIYTELSGITLDTTISTGSQYSPTLVGVEGGFSCQFVNDGLYSTAHSICSGGTIPANGSVTITYTINTPSNISNGSPLIYGVSGSLSPSGVTASDSIMIAPFYSPELVVSAIPSTTSTSVGSTITYRVTIANNGYQTSGSTSLLVVYPDNTTERVSVPSLDPGKNIYFVFPYEMKISGTATTTFFVDPDNLIEENTKSNNTWISNILVYSYLPDLTVSQVQPSTVTKNSFYDKSVIVTNSGLAGAQKITIKDLFFNALPISFTTDHGFTCVKSTYRVGRTNRYLPNGFNCSGGSLLPGESATITAHIQVYSTNIDNNLSVDPNNLIPESNETNNMIYKTLIVN